MAVVVLTAVLAATLVGGITIWKGSQALRVSRQELQADREFEFTLGQYAPPQNIRFEPVRRQKSLLGSRISEIICT